MDSPERTTLEVLSKHVAHADDSLGAPRMLRRMLCTALDIPPRHGSLADVNLFDMPLNE